MIKTLDEIVSEISDKNNSQKDLLQDKRERSDKKISEFQKAFNELQKVSDNVGFVIESGFVRVG